MAKYRQLYKITNLFFVSTRGSILRYILLVGSVLAAFLIIVAPEIWFWGERHEPHNRTQRVVLSSGHTVTQTFTWEKNQIDAVMVMVDSAQSPPSYGNMVLYIDNGLERRSSSLDFTDIPKSGVLVFPISPPLQKQDSEQGKFELSLGHPNQKVALLYQIDSTKYPEGELVGKNGDLAFQLRYKVPALLTSQLWQNTYAFLILVCGLLLFVAFKRNNTPLYSFKRKDALIALLFGLFVTLIYGFWLLRPGYWIGTNDFTKDISYVTASSDAVRNFSWPLWSHITCGGMPLLGNPEGNTISIATLFALVMSPEKATMLLLAIEGGLAMAGTYLLARMLGLRRSAAFLSGTIFSLSPTYAYRLAEGFTMIGASVAFTPWAFLGLVGALKSKSPYWMLLSSFALTAMFLRGEVRVIEYVILALIVWVLYEAFRTRSWFPVYALCVIGSLSFLFSSVKILAFLENPNTIALKLPTTVVLLSQHDLWHKVFFELPDRNTWIPILHGHGEMFGNFGNYIGIVPAILALIGLFLKRNRYRLVLLLIALLLLLIGEGSLYEHFLRRIPVIGSILRLPNRALNVFIFFIAILAGMGIQKSLSLPINAWTKKAFIAVILVFVSINLLFGTNRIFSENFRNRTDMALIDSTNSPRKANQVDAGTLLRSGYLFPQICGDQNIQPEFTKNIEKPLLPSSIANQLSPNNITLSGFNKAGEVTIRERYSEAWIPTSGVALDAGDGSIRVVNPKPDEKLTLKYTGVLARPEQVLLLTMCLTIFFVVSIFIKRSLL